MKRNALQQCFCRTAIFLLLGCMTGCSSQNSASEGTLSSEDTLVTEVAPVSESVSGIPAINENFEGDSHLAIPRGDTVLEIIPDGVNNSNALKISNRTDSWNGVNFEADAFRGNSIKVNAAIKSAGPATRISIQYDVDGNTTYNWIVSVATGSDSFITANGAYDVPGNAENIIIYIEGDTLDDIFLDNFTAEIDGTYIAPDAIAAPASVDISAYPSLKNLYEDYFHMGVAINPAIVSNENFSSLVCSQFDSITLENNLKPESIIDKEATLADLDANRSQLVLDFTTAKAELDWAASQGMTIRGHTLIWHSQTPNWIFYKDYDINGELADRTLMLTRMENYIKDVFAWADTNYPGLFSAWDIVNEAIADNGGLRDSLWRQTIGDDYIEQAFAFARKYAPADIELFYNDYNSYQGLKQGYIIEVLEPIAAAGNLDGVGMQGHISTSVKPELFIKALEKYANQLNVVIHVTELDIVMPNTPAAEYDQGAYHQNLFSTFIEAKKAGIPLESVSFWGLTDTLSWKSNDKPLLFRGDLSAKPAFYGVTYAITGESLEAPSLPEADLSPIEEDFEGSSHLAVPRGDASLKVVTDESQNGEHSLLIYNRKENWNGGMIDITNFKGHTITFSAYVKTASPTAKISANIDGVWPNLVVNDTSSGDWVLFEGTYLVPDDVIAIELYFETEDTTDIYVDNITIKLADES